MSQKDRLNSPQPEFPMQGLGVWAYLIADKGSVPTAGELWSPALDVSTRGSIDAGQNEGGGGGGGGLPNTTDLWQV